MDDTIFTYVSALTAVGGMIGTGIGLYRLNRDRPLTRASASIDANVLADTHQGKTLVQKTSDITRVMGTIGMNSLKGMVMYPLTPPILLPFLLRSDINKRTE